MVKGFGFIGMLHEGMESLLFIPCRVHHAKDPPDLITVHWDNMCASFLCFENTQQKMVLKHVTKVLLKLGESPAYSVILSEIALLLQTPESAVRVLVVHAFPLQPVRS